MDSVATSGDNADPLEFALDFTVISILALGSFIYAGTGFNGSDDAGYIEAARSWVHAIPNVSNFFDDLRYPVILPIAVSIMLLGDSEVTVAIPTLLYAWGCVAITYFGMRSLFDRTTALIAATLLSISPLLAGLATTASVDVCELFFVALSLFAFFVGMQGKRSWPVFLLSGIAAGLAFMTRESSISLLAFYGTLFLANFGDRRKMFLVMAVGFAIVFGAETAWYAMALGDPLHRIHLVAAAMSRPDPILSVGAVDLSSGRIFNISPLLDPIFFSLTNPVFGLIFVVALFAILLIALARKDSTLSKDPVFRWLSILSVLSFPISAYLLCHLALLPRYFLLPLFTTTLAISIWIRFSLWRQSNWGRIALASSLLIVALIGQMITNKSPLYAERVLTSLASVSNEPIFTDPETKFRGTLLYGWANVSSKVLSTPPPPGSLFLYNPKFAGLSTARSHGSDLSDFAPKSDWVEQKVFVERRSALGRLIVTLGLANYLPVAIARRIIEPNPRVTLYRTSA